MCFFFLPMNAYFELNSSNPRSLKGINSSKRAYSTFWRTHHLKCRRRYYQTTLINFVEVKFPHSKTPVLSVQSFNVHPCNHLHNQKKNISIIQRLPFAVSQLIPPQPHVTTFCWCREALFFLGLYINGRMYYVIFYVSLSFWHVLKIPPSVVLCYSSSLLSHV